ncbi:hypothetical protein CAPN001_17520 [Capnocytophaga stomatis]|uniref:formylglycine-generating enzyme family protein n=1 Tax=Capnocytophaga stomatis TaxID=1848904 RepID=UPI00194E1756|nr:SUMF1/EgtB/PvdO family nonheme iron enzyme [Capnocytophaga stomatis]GIJ97183.1 hypothetical protein CAPN001_17520 [Capnocytophaga stomatis]
MKKNVQTAVKKWDAFKLHKFSKGIAVLTVMATTTLTSCNKEEQDFTPSDTVTVETQPEISPNLFSKSIKDNTVFVEGGTFNMGTVSAHKVTLSNFRITKYEITNAEYAQFLNSKKENKIENGAKWYQGKDIVQEGKTFKARAGKENLPVIFVTWNGAKAYAEWAGGRIPTEAEWEYAARGGKKSKGYMWSGSNNIDEVAWYVKNSGGRMHPVGTKKPNELGIYDMSGNAWEWTADWFGSLPRTQQTNPKGANQGSLHVRRGASAFCTPATCRTIYRSKRAPNGVRHNLGFRVVFPAR